MSDFAGFTTRPVVRGTFGVVASSHWLASQTGMAILEKGGNAFDAAVAAGFVLQVVEPHMNGLGGDAVTLIQKAGEQPRVICGQGVAPKGATIAHYKAEGFDIVPGTGLLAAVVPGAFDSWMLMLRDFGTISLEEALAPAIGYARNGYPLLSAIAATIAGMEPIFREEWKSSAAVYLPGGRAPQANALFRNPDLAASYERLAREGMAARGPREAQIEAAREAYYAGFVAEAIEKFVTRDRVLDSSGERHKGILTGADMAAWRASYEEPVRYEYRGLKVCKAGAWSQGPVMLQTLALLKNFDVAAMDTMGPDFAHVLVEAMKLAFADRDAWYGDPDFVDVPLKALLSDEYNAARRQLIGARASLELRPGSPEGRAPRLPKLGGGVRGAAGMGEPGRVQTKREAGIGEPARAQALGPSEGDTCHLDVMDRFGNTVAATPSGGWLQSSPVVPGLGFCLGTRAQMFWLEEGVASSLAPGRRPRTTLTPTLALDGDGKAMLAFGSPGGDSQDQWIAQFFLRHVEHGLDLQAAIDAPMLQSDHWPNSFYPRGAEPGLLMLESRFPKETVEELARRGHRVELAGPWSLGRNCAAARHGDVLEAAATPRYRQAYAVGR